MKQKFFTFTWIMFGLIVAALAGLEYFINKNDQHIAQKQYKLVVNDETLKNAKDERTQINEKKTEQKREENTATSIEEKKDVETKTDTKSAEETA